MADTELNLENRIARLLRDNATISQIRAESLATVVVTMVDCDRAASKAAAPADAPRMTVQPGHAFIAPPGYKVEHAAREEVPTSIVEDVAGLFAASGFDVRMHAGQFAITGSLDAAGVLVEKLLGQSDQKPAGCSGTPASCPENEGYGCHCGYGASSTPAVPGTKVVPITPTLEMVKAGDATMNGRGTCVLAWRVMVDAAPSHPSEAKTCTCPSGDGSLRWPCPVHPSEAKAGEDA